MNDNAPFSFATALTSLPSSLRTATGDRAWIWIPPYRQQPPEHLPHEGLHRR
jgi:hypothetical protein